MGASMLVALMAALVPIAMTAPPEAALQQQVIDQNSLAYMGNRWKFRLLYFSLYMNFNVHFI